MIKLEAYRKNKQTAHIGYITQFEYIHGELISVGNDIVNTSNERNRFAMNYYITMFHITGSDGWVRFWFYETMDLADLPSNERLLVIQPIYEFHITEGEGNFMQEAMLMSIQKQEPNDPDDTFWYAQVII